MAYYKLSEVEEIIADIKGFGLSRPTTLDKASLEELQKQFNGAGNDALPFLIRKLSTKALWCLRATIAIHDHRYTVSDGTKEGQLTADKEFFTNGHIEIYARLRWWNPLRYWCLYKLNAAYRILQQFGESAYLSAHERYSTKD